MFTNFLKISLIFIIWIFEKIMNEFTNEFIELNLILIFLNFSHFAKLFIKFLKPKGSHQKKTGKKVHNSCELWGGQQILVCELQKSAFLELIFQKTC